MRILLIFLCTLCWGLVGFSQTPGVVESHIACAVDKNQSYALYLPSYYDSKKKWPIIFIFEPAARGALAVKKFQPGAEELGYIIMASNNSRNGSWESSFTAAQSMMNDAFLNYSVDSALVYTSGFSGGSRAASAIAKILGNVNGVIACGAGFSNNENYRLSDNSDIKYIALVGDQDMNYPEHIELQSELTEKHVVNHLMIFHGGHRWPEPDLLTEALYWLELQNINEGKPVSKRFSVKTAYQEALTRADSIYDLKHYVLARKVYSAIQKNFNQHIDLQEVNEKISLIEDLKDYKKQLRASRKISNREASYRMELSKAFNDVFFYRMKGVDISDPKDMPWWKNKIDELKRLSDSEEIEVKHMALRLLNVVSANSYESSIRFIREKNYQTALDLLKIRLYVDPTPWIKWNMAQVMARLGDRGFYAYLKESVEQMPNLKEEHVVSNPAFNPYLEDSQMKRILNLLK